MFHDSRIEDLKAYRLERGLSFDRLADEMTAAGFPTTRRSLHLAMTGRLRTMPRELTLYKFAKFLQYAVARAQQRAARQRARARAMRSPKRKKTRRAAA